MINKKNLQDIYPLSMMQEGMLFHALFQPGTDAYFEQSTYDLHGEFDYELFKESLERLVARHDILRTLFVHKNVSRPFQVVMKQGAAKISFTDFSNNENQQEAFEAFKLKDRANGFQLEKESPMRVAIVKISDQMHRVIWSHHHILMDGWCMAIIIGDFLANYKALRNNEQLALPPVTPYSTYIKWLEKQDKEKAKEYWKTALEGIEKNTVFPKKQSASKSYKKSTFESEIPVSERTKLEELCKKYAFTPANLFQAAWSVLLGTWNRSDDVVFGSVVAGRPPEIPNVAQIVGLFINTIPIRSKLDGTFIELAKRKLLHQAESLPYQYLPLAETQKLTPNNAGLINHLLVFENFPISEKLDDMKQEEFGFTLENKVTFEQTSYDLNVIVIPDKGWKIKIDYNQNVYEQELVASLLPQLLFIFEQVLEKPEIAVSDIKLEKQTNTFSTSEKAIQHFKSISEHLDEAVKNVPSATALTWKGTAISYQQLDEKINCAANALLHSYNLKSGDRIGLCCERSGNTIVAILALMRLGITYIPISPETPLERLLWLAEDASMKGILVEENRTHSSLDIPLEDLCEGSNAPVQHVYPAADQLAYILYTSGSTGQPKGCMISQANIAAYIGTANASYFEQTEGNFPLYTALSFDLTLTSIFCSLTRGKTLHISDPDLSIAQTLEAVFHPDSGIDSVKMTPSHIALLAGLELKETGIKMLITGGDQLTIAQVKSLRALNPNMQIFNEYGPTETTVGCMIKEIETNPNQITIGKAMPGLFTYIVDKKGVPVPKGIPGELWISGQNTGIGYLNRAELTQEKFISDPFRQGEKLYKTGDLVRELSNGELVFIERIDNQVKLRGFRIEPGEIDAAMRHIDGLNEAVAFVLNKEHLIAVYTGEALAESALRKELALKLPAYLIPDRFVHLEEIPLNKNGKIDQYQLVELVSNEGGNVPFIAPAGHVQLQVAQAWTKILGVEKPGIHDHFFRSGGHSLKAMMLVSHLNKALQKEVLDVRTVFTHPTIEALSNHIKTNQGKDWETIPKAPIADDYPVTKGQSLLWLTDINDEGPAVFQTSGGQYIKGKLDLEKLEKAIQTVIQKHEILRTAFKEQNGELRQIVIDDVKCSIQQLDFSKEKNAQETASNWFRKQTFERMPLDTPPLIRVTLIQLDEEESLLFYTVHHLVSDGWSKEIFLREIAANYRQRDGESAPLEIQYKDYTVWKLAQEKQLDRKKEIAFWSEHLGGALTPPSLPYDAHNKANTHEGSTQNFELPKALSKRISRLCQRSEVTPNVFFMSILGLCLQKLCRESNITIRTIHTGREHAELEELIGYFVQLFPIRLLTHPQSNFSEYLKTSAKRFIETLEHSHLSFSEIAQEFGSENVLHGALLNVDYYYQNLGSGNDSSDAFGTGIQMRAWEEEAPTAFNDLAFTIGEQGDQFGLSINYNTALFKPETIDLIGISILHLLKQILDKPGQKLADYSLFPENDGSLFQLTGTTAEQFERILPATNWMRDLHFEKTLSPEKSHSQLYWRIFPHKSNALTSDVLSKASANFYAFRTKIIPSNPLFAGLVPISKTPAASLLTGEIKGNSIAQEVQSWYLEQQLADAENSHALLSCKGQQIQVFVTSRSVADETTASLFFETVDAFIEGGTPPIMHPSHYLLSLQQHALVPDDADLQKFKKEAVDVLPYTKLVSNTSNAKHKFEIVGQQLQLLREMCAAEEIDASHFIKAAFAQALRVLFYEDGNISFREILNGRSIETATTAGPFTWMLPHFMVSNEHPKDTFKELLSTLSETPSGWKHIPVSQQNAISGSQGVQFYFTYNDRSNEKLESPKYQAVPLLDEAAINFYCQSFENGLRIELDHVPIPDFVDHFMQIVQQILEEGFECKLLDIKRVTTNPIQELPFYTYPSFSSALKKAVEASKSQPAIQFNEKVTSYESLWEKSLNCAKNLKEIGIGKGDLIAIHTYQCTENIVLLAAILHLEASWLPIDPGLPQDRKAYMLEDSNAKALVSINETAELGDWQGTIVTFEQLQQNNEHAIVMQETFNAEQPACIIYTSGSTGRPKGVQLTIGNLIHYALTGFKMFNVAAGSRILATSATSFDLSITESVLALLNQFCIVIPDQETNRDPELLAAFILDQKVDLVQTTPSRIHLLINQAGTAYVKQLKHIIMAGEATSEVLKQKLLAANGAVSWSAYGPTETTVLSSGNILDQTPVSIGIPFDGEPFIVLDKNRLPLPVGCIGDVAIGGYGVAKGYHNRAELTAERFISYPSNANQRFYISGDLAWQDVNSKYYFAGRADNQLKIRGYRIEPDGVKTLLELHPNIQQAYCGKFESATEASFVAWVKSNVFDELEIRKYLAQKLPPYMIPDVFVVLEKFPLNHRGKIDGKLLKLDENAVSFVSETQTEEEKQLATLWQQVLNRSHIGREDNFFMLGGHSLRAASLSGKINAQFGRSFPIRNIFAFPVLKDMAKAITGASDEEKVAIQKAEEKAFYPVSPSQQRIFALQHLDPDDTSYNMSWLLGLKGKLDEEKLTTALHAIVQRHEALRTRFVLQDGIPQQQIGGASDFEMERLQGTQEGVKTAFQQFVKPFHLQKDLPIRIALYTVNAENASLFFDIHHISGDGLTAEILTKELAVFYAGETLPDLRLQYKDFSEWQHQEEYQQTLEKQGNYWKKQLEGEVPVLHLPTDFARPAEPKRTGAKSSYRIDETTTKGLRELNQKQGLTTFMSLLAVINLLLSRYSRQNDIIVGTPVAGRSNIDLEKIVGVFINTLALRFQIDSKQSGLDFLKQVKATVLEALENQDYPFEKLVTEVKPERVLNRSPFFDVMFILQNRLGDSTLKLGDLEISNDIQHNQHARFDLTFEALELENETVFNIEYSTELFEKNTIDKMFGHFLLLLKGLIQDEQKPLGAIAMLSEQEKRRSFSEVNLSNSYKNVISSIFEISKSKPNEIAIEWKVKGISYTELAAKIGSTAFQFNQKYNIQANDRVGIYTDRSLETLVAILALLRMGAVYVPIAPNTPTDRLHYLIEDAGLKGLLVERENEISSIDIPLKTLQTKDDKQFEGAYPTENQAAYILYTSGSTGQPKGCVISHGNISHYVAQANAAYFGKTTGNFPLYTDLAFDFTLTSIFCSLSRGKLLRICDPEIAIHETLEQVFKANSGLDSIKVTPAHISLLEGLNLKETGIKMVITGGEQLRLDQVATLRKLNPEVQIFNEYGPTESTVGCIVKEIEQNPQRITIGTALPGTNTYIVDENGTLLPQGIPGELWLSGAGTGQGYLNRETLTAEKFVSDPFRSGEKLYKTGDLVRELSNGELLFMQRLDDQIKLRGYRIEPEEITHAILQHSTVEDAVVHVIKGPAGNDMLCAWIKPNSDYLEEKLSVALHEKLPAYMVPSAFVVLEEIPLTSNGKVNKRLLPKPTLAAGIRQITQANTKAEAALIEVWEKLFQIECGRESHFFRLGGDSIKAIQVISRLQQFGFKLEMKSIFKAPILMDLALLLEETSLQISQDPVVGSVPLLPIQKAFIAHPPEDRNHYNQSIMLFREDGFDTDLVRFALKNILEHHDALRAILSSDNSEEMIILSPENVKVELLEIECETTDIEAEAQKVQESFVLTAAPLFKAALFQTKDGAHLLMVAHHFVVDGISWRIVLEDLEMLLDPSFQTDKQALPPKTHSIIDWSKGLQKLSETPAFVESNYYSKNTIEQPDKWENVPETGTYKAAELTLSEESTQLLLTKAHQTYNTQINDLLLAGLWKALRDWSKQEQFLLHMESHGREDVIPYLNISRTAGWFTAEYPVPLQALEDDSWPALIVNTKEKLQQIGTDTIGWGILRHLSDSGLESISYPKVKFNYLGQFDSDIKDRSYQISPLSFGINQSRFEERGATLEINGYVAGGKLHFDVDYGKKYLNSATVADFASQYEQALEDLIQHCLQSETQRTPSDYGMPALSPDDLAHILKSLKTQQPSDIYRLSPMQEGMLFHHLMDAHSGAYFEQSILTAEGEIDPEIFKTALQELVDRHTILRTRIFSEQLENPVQTVLKQDIADFVFHSKDEIKNDSETWIKSLILKDREKGFHLSNAPLMRVQLVQTEEKYTIIWSHHHILLDGWCMGILFQEFLEIFKAKANKKLHVLPPAKPYRNYIDWIYTQPNSLAKDYWSALISDYDTRIQLPGKLHSEAQKPVFRQHGISFDATSTKKMQANAAQLGATVSSILHAAWGITLQKLNYSDEAVFGTVVSGRPPALEGIEQMPGLFINSVPVRVKARETFGKTVLELQEQMNESNERSYFPLHQIQQLSPLKQDLLHHLFIVENYPLETALLKENSDELGWKITQVENFEETHFELRITINIGETIYIEFDYDSNKRDGKAIKEIAGWYEKILLQTIENSDVQLTELSIIEEQDHAELIALNPAPIAIPQDTHLGSMLEASMKKHANLIALKNDSGSITFGELDDRSQRIAAFLQKRGAKKEVVVAILIEPGFDMISAIVGIIRSGAAYLPIDASYPKSRVEHMLNQTEAIGVVTSPAMQDLLPESASIIYVEDAIKANPKDFKILERNLNDLLYVIYTSGTTGLPKGVMIIHQNVCNFLHHLNELYQIKTNECVVMNTSIAFDTSVIDLYTPMLNGATMRILEDRKDLNKLVRLIEEGEINILSTTPRVLEFVDHEAKQFGNLRLVTSAGEAMHPGHIQNIVKHATILNGYGPTEVTVLMTYHPVTGEEKEIPIGIPIRNTEVFVLDKNLQPAPKGAIGHLYIGGACMARGYLKEPELTASKFIDHPTLKRRLYASGDLGKWNKDNELEFRGRTDFQIKIRGYRIEATEVESALTEHEFVDKAAVLAIDDQKGNAMLVAWITTLAGYSEKSLTMALAAHLPEYMIPAVFVVMDEIPMTGNGKLNRSALPMPELKEETLTVTPPTSENEHILVEVWEDVLGTKCGRESHFFSLGGDSIKAIQMSSRLLRKALKVEIADIFDAPILWELATRLKPAEHIAPQDSVTGHVRFTPTQKQLLAANYPDLHHYNQSFLLHAKQGWEEKALLKSFELLAKHHDALRMIFPLQNGERTQFNRDVDANHLFHFEVFNPKDETEFKAMADALQASVVIETGPLMKVGLFHHSDGDHLLILIHHLAVDGVGWRILFEDLATVYPKIMAGEIPELPLKSDSYKDWSEALHAYATSTALLQQLPYWEKLVAEAPALAPDPEGISLLISDTDHLSTKLDPENTQKLLTEVHHAYNTEINDLLLAALSQAWKNTFGEAKMLLDLEGHGREDILKDININRTIGWFTSFYPVVVQAANENPDELIKTNKEILRKIPDKGVGYGILKYLTPTEKKGTFEGIQPQMSFNYLGQFEDVLQNEAYTISKQYGGAQVSARNPKGYRMALGGYTLDQQLTLDAAFNKHLFSKDKVQELLEEWKTILTQLIVHCASKDETERTVSDFGSKDLTSDELDDILDMIDDI